MSSGLDTHSDSTIREDLIKQKFSKKTYWDTKRAKKHKKKKKKG